MSELLSAYGIIAVLIIIAFIVLFIKVLKDLLTTKPVESALGDLLVTSPAYVVLFLFLIYGVKIGGLIGEIVIVVGIGISLLLLFLYDHFWDDYISQKRTFAEMDRSARFSRKLSREWELENLKAKRCRATSHIYTVDGAVSLTFKTKGKSNDKLREAIFEDIHDFFLSHKFQLERHRYAIIYGIKGSRFLQPLLGRFFSPSRYAVDIEDWFHDEILLRVEPCLPRWGILDFTLAPILKLIFGVPLSERFLFKLGKGNQIINYFSNGAYNTYY